MTINHRQSNIKHLLIDLGGVLILQSPVDWSDLERRFHVTHDTILDIIRDCFKQQSKDNSFNITAYYADKHKKTLPYEIYKEAVQKIYNTEHINRQLIEWLKQKRKKLNIAAVTNNTGDINKLLKTKFGINNLFDIIFNSADIGFAKPDQRFFDYVLTQLKTTASQCLFIDDNATNIKAASEKGFYAILFTNTKDFIKEVQKLGL